MKGIIFDDSGGAFTKVAFSLEGTLVVFPPWLMESDWGFQGNSEFASWAFLLNCPPEEATDSSSCSRLHLMATGEELDLPALGGSVYLERKNKMNG